MAPLRFFLNARHVSDMNPAVMVVANKSLAFSLYDFYLEGVSAQELAAAYALPVHCVEERIEAVRLCLQFQAKATLDTRKHFNRSEPHDAPQAGTRYSDENLRTSADLP